MSSKIKSLAVMGGDTLFYTPEFRRVLEDHLVFIKEHPQTQQLNIGNADSHTYHNNFYGLLSVLNVPPHMWWFTLRLNGMRSPQEYSREQIFLFVADPQTIIKLRGVFASKYKK